MKSSLDLIVRFSNSFRMTSTTLTLILILIGQSKSMAQTWEPTNGPLGGRANVVAVDTSGQIFVGSGSGVFQSTSNGDNWTKTGGSVFSTFLTSMVVSPDSNFIFVGTTNVGLYRSRDNGDSWDRLATVLPPSSVDALSLGLDGDIFAASDRDGVFKSSDNGESWTEMNNGLADLKTPAVAVSKNGDVYAGSLQTGVYRLGVSDTSWMSLSSGLANFRTYWLQPIGVDEMLAAVSGKVYRISGGDTTWTQLGTGNPTVITSIVIDHMDQIFLSSTIGVYLYDEMSDTWNRMIDGLTNIRVGDLAVNQAGDLFAASDGGVFRSQDSGATWTAQIDGFKISRVMTLVGLPDGSVLAGTESNGFFLSDNDGQSWEGSNAGLSQLSVRSAIINSNEVVFAGISGQNGIVRSNDNGASWETVTNGLIGGNFSTLAATGASIYTSNSSGIFTSTDGGDSWTVVPDSGRNNNGIRALALNASGTLFAGTFNGGVFRLAANDTIWTEVNNGLTNLRILTLMVDDSNNLFAGFSGGGAFRSADNGDNWVEVSQGLPSTSVYVLTQAPWGRLFAGTSFGIAYSDDDGDNWLPMSIGLENLSIRSLFIRSDNQMFAGTYGDGIYRTQLIPTSVDLTPEHLPASFSLNQNYPNPFNPATTITFSIAQPSDIRLIVYDLLGREVRNLLHKKVTAGSHTIAWDGKDAYGRPVASGQYLYRLEADDFEMTKKMLFLR